MPFIKSKKDIWLTPSILTVVSIVLAVENEDPRGTVVWAVVAFLAGLMAVYGGLCHLKFKKDQQNAEEQNGGNEGKQE
jgi:hypothetical protein